MTKLIIIRGNSASGKTSLATALQKTLNSKSFYLSQDYLRRHMLFTKDGENTATIPLIINLLHYAQKEKYDFVILEGILYSDWYHPVFQEAKRLFQDQIYAYYYAISFQETVKRHQTREKVKEFGEEALRRWWRENDFSPILNEKTITENLSLEQTVQMILEDIEN